MKRELAALLALAMLAAASAWNIRHVQRLSDELYDVIADSRAAYEAGARRRAAETLDSAIQRWDRPVSYAAVALRHTEIDTITDNFYSLLADLYDEGDAARGSYAGLLASIKRLAEMETPSLGSIF
jgi:hypothetical protein